MYFKYTLVFSVTFLTSLLASIPFGPINLNVIYTTVQTNKKAGLTFAAAAAIVELLQSFIAIQVSPSYLVPFLDHYLTIIFTSIFLILLGIFFLYKKEKDKKYTIQQPSEYIGFYQFGRGMLVALLNIPTIAFWIAMTTYFKSIKLFDLKDTSTTYLIICFISAAALGKLITLSSYALLADKFLPHLGKFRKFLPKLIGILLIMMGLFQVFRIFIFDLAAQIK
jgi:threonine/homoserine/homoserine lactone efflux protein